MTVNTDPAATRQGRFFAHELAADNSGGPVWQQVDVEATLGPDTETESGHRYLPVATFSPNPLPEGRGKVRVC